MDTTRQALDAHGLEHDGFRRQLTQALGSHAGAGARPDQPPQEK
jgi:serine/threonine protein phosphatase PrpC